jgi:hypothetical protein
VRLRGSVIAAVNARKVPAALLEPLTSAVNSLPGRIMCAPPQPTAAPVPAPTSEHKHGRGHGHEHGHEHGHGHGRGRGNDG